LIQRIRDTFFFWDRDAKDVRSRGLMEDDPLEHTIVDSGDFVALPQEIQFSSYSGCDIHPEVITKMFKRLPRGVTLTVVGFDMDDYPGEPEDQAAVLIIKPNQSPEISRVSSRRVAKTFFPKLYAQLEESRGDPSKKNFASFVTA
jgi:hypothetical protein